MLEHDTPEKLLENEASAFSKMVQNTGPANAQYLRGLVFQMKEEKEANHLDGKLRRLASSRWAAATNLALAISLTSSKSEFERLNFLNDEDNILKQTKDAVITLQGVLEGKHDEEINNTLYQYQVPRDGWWSALYRIIEG